MKPLFLFALFFSFITISTYSQDVESVYKKGYQQLTAGDYKEAIKMFDEAIKLDPKHLNSHLQRAFCYGATGMYNEAVADYTAILEQQPKQKFALNSRGSMKNKLKQYKEAMTDFDAALAIDGNFAEAYNNRGWAKDGLGDHDGACKDWNTSKKMGNEEAKIILKNTRCK